MAEKVFTKFFENFKGLDLRASDLTRKPEYASQLDNYILDRTQTLIGRKGFKAASQHANRSTGPEYPLWGLYNYIYLDQNTGETKEELIGVGDTLYRLAEGTITIAYAGAGAVATFSFLPNTVGWIVDLQVDGVSQAGFPLNITHNASMVTPTTFSTLRTAINAVAGFTCTLTPWAQVNGLQAGRNMANPITVVAGHTVTISGTRPTTLPFIDRNSTDLVFIDFVAQGATTLTPREDIGVTYTVNNGDEIGVAHATIFSLPIIDTVSVKPTATFTFTYWERVYCSGYQESQNKTLSPFTGTSGSIMAGVFAYTPTFVAPTDPSFTNISATNQNNTLYIACPNSISADFWTGIGPNFNELPRRETGLLQYDSQQVSLGTIPQAKISAMAAVAGAGLSVGEYKYLVRYKFTNKQAQLFWGSDSLILEERRITTTGVNAQVTVQVFIAGALNSCFFLPINTSIVNGNQVAVVTITVLVPAAPKQRFRVGDIATFIDRATGLIQNRSITGVTTTTITISGAVVSVNNGDTISNGLSFEVFRTTVFGNQYYLQGEYPIAPNDTLTITDVTPDTSLVVKWDGPFLGTNRRDIAPVVTKIASHQGALVGTGDRLNPNTAFWSVPGEPYAWPAGTNNTDVPSSIGGILTAIASDNENSLIVGKGNAYYAISGDLGTAQVSVTTSSEGDVGIPGQSSIVKARSSLVYLSNKGPRVSLGGDVDGFGDRLISAFLNNNYTQQKFIAVSSTDENKLVLQRAVSGHDIEGQKILLWMGGESGAPGIANYNLRPNGTSFVFVYDYANDIFTKYVFSTEDANNPYNMAGGIASYKGDLYFISRFIAPGSTQLRGALYKFNNTNTRYDYQDDSYKIVHTWRPSHDTGDDPSVNKEFLRLKVYSFLPSTLTFGTFNITLSTYKDFIDSISHFTTVYSFSASTTKEKLAKLRSDKMRVCLFQFVVSAIFESPRITGYEYVIALPYQKDDLA